MIFWFSGTGNSLYTAGRLAGFLNDKTISITKALKQKEFVYAVGENEPVGFVFPVYFGGLPDLVAEFISKLRLEENPIPYIYAVLVNGGNCAACDKMLKKALDERRIPLKCVFNLKMPDNYILMYEPTSKIDAKKIKAQADRLIDRIVVLVNHRSRQGYESTPVGSLTTGLLYPLYLRGRKTEKFFADYRCIGCGKCAKFCPCEAIEMYKGKPRWVKSQCTHCTACINGCPQKALQYGKGTINRRRYVHECIK